MYSFRTEYEQTACPGGPMQVGSTVGGGGGMMPRGSGDNDPQQRYALHLRCA
ncbi:MAG: hypothetical protein AAF611_22015 [Bacteroidota bacterium]